ncbi:hypothetical protein R1sor_019928 [Riccia sorocarpa]|uniref:DUF7148 domain-containing protein n=1 Tax=Riccia sorocarpa TaxID=122646 RepID=A0ABD3II42_9MARC
MACSLIGTATAAVFPSATVPVASRIASRIASSSTAAVAPQLSNVGTRNSDPGCGISYPKSFQCAARQRRNCGRSVRVNAEAVESGETALAETQWGPPVQLATGKIPDDVDLKLFESLLFKWGSSLTQNANLPLPVPLKVDRIAGGVRLGYVKVVEAIVEEVCHIDVVVVPKSDDQPKALMVALRNGKLKDTTPPAEPLIMQSLLQALRTAVANSRRSQ